ncbi:MAG: pyridoxamine 5'-phosphate oxidase family protein [Enterococcaceae bacterium]|jgi:uncharacterized pyridoxamine 5'-phosphate oxidase family protein|nr:pyridoxamine 5'-phosphate oxidase family protein [Enterococcaceae bacterium]MCI1919567.1 pyridoxamine 5'-phosphate oxidase family protein [Enterococcaceae bacterium]
MFTEQMNATDYLHYLKNKMHSTVFATIDEEGRPATRVVDIMLLKNDKLYFLTADNKQMYRQMLRTPFIALTGLEGSDTMSSRAISLQGAVREIGQKYLPEILEQNPYMNQIYETPARQQLLRVFEIYEGKLSAYDLSQKPIFQKELFFGGE